MKIFVGSLPFAVDEARLREYFEKYGEVNSANIVLDKMSGRSRGFGFVEMADEQQARKAIQELNGSEMSGRTIVVNPAEERRESSGGGGGYKGGNNRGGGSGSYGSRDNNRGSYNKNGGNRGGRDDRY